MNGESPLYFGSVKFFKHLIIILVAVLTVIATICAVFFGIQNAELRSRNAKLELDKESLAVLVEYYSGGKNLTPDEIRGVMEASGVTDEQLVSDIYEKNPDAFAAIIELWRGGRLPDNTVDVDAQQTELTRDVMADGNETLQPYTSLYPELYVDSSVEAGYTDDAGTIYLTFDDGPSEYTEKILEILDKFDIKATFFLIPKDTDESFELMNKIVEAGHTIGVHSSSHVYDKIYASVENYLDDFNAAFELIYEATGQKCRLFRFPGGSINSYNSATSAAVIEEMKRRGFIYFDWNVDSEDGIGATWTQMYNNVMTETSGNDRSIILMHDGIYNTTLVLEDIINALLADSREFKFSALGENVRPLQF